MNNLCLQKSWLALLIAVLVTPARADTPTTQQSELKGGITAINSKEHTLTIKPRGPLDTPERIVKFDTETEIVVEDKPAKVEDLKVGLRVRLIFKDGRTSKIEAKEFKAPKSATQSAR